MVYHSTLTNVEGTFIQKKLNNICFFAHLFVPLHPHLMMYPTSDEGGRHLKDVLY